jgi:hypothetical protein
MASVQGEINRIATAKSDIESAIEYCGVDVPNTALISTYADYIRAIPTTIFSKLNYDSVGGTDKYIESISQSNGVISATTGTTATTAKSGLMSKADKAKLDDIADGADSVSFSRELTSGVKIGTITISGTDTTLYCKDTWVANALNTAGYVAAPTSSNANMVWKCDSSGKPAWRADANTNYYPKRKFSTGLQITDTSDSTNYTDGNIYVPIASASRLGVIRINYTTSGKNYKLTVNANGDAYTNVPWINYYATAFSWTAGSTSGPTGTLTMQDTDDVTFPAIPSASATASGIVTTTAQTFAGTKSFNTGVKVTEGTQLTLQASSSSSTDPGDLIFANGSGSELMRLWYDSSNATANKRFSVRFAGGTTYSVLHTGNSSVTLNGQTITVNIGGTSKSLTNYYPIRSYSTGLQISTSSDTTNYASGALYVPHATTTQAGVISTAAQSFAGQKTFINGIKVGTVVADNSTDNAKIYFGDGSIVWIGEADQDDALTLNCGSSDCINFSWGGSKKTILSSSALYPVTSGGITLGTTSNKFGNVYAASIGTSSYRCTYGYFSSAVYATSGFYESSDEVLKNILNPVKVNLDELSKLRKVYYTWKNDSEEKLQLGMIAQDVQKLYPELVCADDETGILSLAYDKLSVIALEAVDVLYQECKQLRSKIDILETRVKNTSVYTNPTN